MKEYVTDIYFKKPIVQKEGIVAYSESDGRKNTEHNNSISQSDIIVQKNEQIDNYDFPDDYKSWERFENDNFAFMSIVTHECRSSLTKDILAPFARYTDNRMSIVTVSKTSKIGLLYFLTKIADGKHMQTKHFV